MTYHAITPFRRSVDAALLAHQKHAQSHNSQPVNKWDVLRELSTARKEFGLSDRDLGVLRALLTFHPETELCGQNLIVYPSNAAISERLNGMPLSTLRRHLARLVGQGVLLRRDSSNGKRFVNRRNGVEQAFGFDLTPLVSRAHEIQELAEHTRQSLAKISQLRQELSLMRRDLIGLTQYLADKDQVIDYSLLIKSAGDILRRQAQKTDLEDIQAHMRDALHTLNNLIDIPLTEEMSTNTAENERHYQNSNKDINESEVQPKENSRPTSIASTPITSVMPLSLVLETCKEIQLYISQPIHQWQHLVAAADCVSSMMGISPDLWQRAKLTMGNENSAVTLASMLERFTTIRSPSAYLRALITKAERRLFSVGPMLRALMHAHPKSSQL